MQNGITSLAICPVEFFDQIVFQLLPMPEKPLPASSQLCGILSS